MWCRLAWYKLTSVSETLFLSVFVTATSSTLKMEAAKFPSVLADVHHDARKYVADDTLVTTTKVAATTNKRTNKQKATCTTANVLDFQLRRTNTFHTCYSLSFNTLQKVLGLLNNFTTHCCQFTKAETWSRQEQNQGWMVRPNTFKGSKIIWWAQCGVFPYYWTWSGNYIWW